VEVLFAVAAKRPAAECSGSTHVYSMEHLEGMNRRVFEKKTMTAPLVFNCILEEMGLRQAALRALSAT